MPPRRNKKANAPPPAENAGALLRAACRTDDFGRVALLLDTPTDTCVNLVDWEGECGLMLACMNGNVDIATLLLEKKADIDQADDRGGTALHRAICDSHDQIVTLLMEKGADATLTDGNGQTALDIARGQGNEVMVMILTAAWDGAGLKVGGGDGGETKKQKKKNKKMQAKQQQSNSVDATRTLHAF
jgi:ankyrin repeat protein